jgi:hypothetical protein
VQRARRIQKFLSQPFQVAEVFTGYQGRLVAVKDTIKAFKEILSGKHDDLPEQAFYMVGDIEEVQSKARTMAGEETKADKDKAKKAGGASADWKKETVDMEGFKRFSDAMYKMFDETCEEEIAEVAEFPEEVARLKVKHAKVRLLMQKVRAGHPLCFTRALNNHSAPIGGEGGVVAQRAVLYRARCQDRQHQAVKLS